MAFESLFDISGSGMKAQMLRMEIVSANMANVNATRTPEGGPYRRQLAVFQTVPVHSSFADAMMNSGAYAAAGVEVSKVVEDNSPFMRKYDPNHPDADAEGYVLYPNVNIVTEMVDMQEAARSYEANISVLLSLKNMIAKTFEIGR